MTFNNTLNHISFIMDGNNRWAKKNNISKFESYKNGAIKLFKISDHIFRNYDVKYISAFALSSHNLNRTNKFIKTFIDVLNYFLDEFNKLNFDYRVIFIGDLKFISNNKTINRIKEIEKYNINSKKTLLIYINYSGRQDIIETLRKHQKSNKINLSNFDSSLSKYKIPDPDMLIRTGGFQRLSDFLLYEVSFTELFFTKKLWPNFQIKDLKLIINKYFKIERKFGV